VFDEASGHLLSRRPSMVAKLHLRSRSAGTLASACYKKKLIERRVHGKPSCSLTRLPSDRDLRSTSMSNIGRKGEAGAMQWLRGVLAPAGRAAVELSKGRRLVYMLREHRMSIVRISDYISSPSLSSKRVFSSWLRLHNTCRPLSDWSPQDNLTLLVKMP
jgi:hypothetical protein